jgi:hypothetical protein
MQIGEQLDRNILRNVSEKKPVLSIDQAFLRRKDGRPQP